MVTRYRIGIGLNQRGLSYNMGKGYSLLTLSPKDFQKSAFIFTSCLQNLLLSQSHVSSPYLSQQLFIGPNFFRE